MAEKSENSLLKKKKRRDSVFFPICEDSPGDRGIEPMQPAGLQTVINVVSREEAASGEKSL
jgi:hypothetical protein